MSRFTRFAHYVPVTSFPNEPVDRTRFPSDAIVGLNWGKGSAFDYSAKLRFNEDQSGLAINLAEGEDKLPKKRVILEAVCTVQQSTFLTEWNPTIDPLFEDRTLLLLPDTVSWKVTTILPKTYIGQLNFPTRTWDYELSKANWIV